MKKTILLIIIILTLYNNINAQWYPLNSNTKLDLRDIHFTDTNIGYAVGGDESVYTSLILKTLNAGLTWDTIFFSNSLPSYPLPPHCSPIIQSIFFLDSQNAYAVGGRYLDYSTFINTNNSGLTWNYFLDWAAFGIIYSVYMKDTNTGFIVNGNINKTIDGGKNWTIQNTNWTDNLYSIYFTDTNTGYAVGDDQPTGAVLKTIDGGTNWTKQSFTNAYNFYSIFFTDKNTAYISGYGSILKTTDAGTTWNTLLSGTDYHLWKIRFIDSLSGYAVGHSFNTGGVILKTIDGGANWSVQNLGFSKMLYSVYFTSADTGYAVGDSGVILKTTNGGGMGIPILSNNKTNVSVYPNPAKENLTITYPQLMQEGEIEIYNILGQIILNEKLAKASSQLKLNIHSYKSGIYKAILREKGMIKGEVSILKN